MLVSYLQHIFFMYNISKWEEVGIMYFGKFEHSLDSKNRLLIPSKIKEVLSRKVYIMKGFDGCVSLYDENGFNNLTSKMSELSYTKANERTYIRLLLASVVEIQLDSVGRILIPVDVMNKYSLEKDLIILGCNDHLEIWNKTKWNEFEETNLSKLEEVAEGLFNE